MDTISELIEETMQAFKKRNDPRFKREIEMLQRMREKLKKESEDAGEGEGNTD